MSGAFSKFELVLCIGLASSFERREHARAEFRRVNALNHCFIDAFSQDSDAVVELFESDFVRDYPPCFRCGKNDCNCDNKCLFPAQVANWVSHQRAWHHVAGQDSRGLFLLCEDDVKFTDNASPAIVAIFSSARVQRSLASERPVLVRLGWAWCSDHESNAAPRLGQDIKMSNPCYAINAAMAHTLINSLERIETTSDVYVHQLIGPKVNHFTVMPPAAFELSWSTGELGSEIRPKKKRIEYLRQQLERLDPHEPDAARLRNAIEVERRSIIEFDLFNRQPAAGRFRR